MLTQAALKEVLSYDPKTGSFRWLSAVGKRVQAGAEAGSVDKGYVRIRLFGERHRAHRLAFLYMTGEWPTEEVDHINGIRTDNRWSNLRGASGLENQRNKGLRSNNVSGTTGVAWVPAKCRWRAFIDRNGKTEFLGYFTEKDGAVAARQDAERQIYGAFAPSDSRPA